MIKALINIADSDISLRPYQVDSKKKIYEAWLLVRSVLFQMPTGTGKTRLFASIIKDIRLISVQQKIIPQPRILVLAHRTELIEQIAYTITNKYYITCGIIKSGSPEDRDALVQVASVQSLSRRLSKWDSTPFAFIVIDEAHHALAKTYMHICSAYPASKILGVTATPYRLSGESFRKIFDTLIISPSVQSFIDSGYLSSFQYYSIKPSSYLEYELDSIRVYGVDGDYAENELVEACDKIQVRAQLTKSYEKYAKGRKGIVYTINKVHNNHVAQQYKDIGVRVATIDSDTPVEERSRIVYDFRNGKYDIICNVNIFSEGFDCPDIEFIQLARPTLSLSLYLQQVGRALRISDNKHHALILDNVGSYNKFGLPNRPVDWVYYFNRSRDITHIISKTKPIKALNEPKTITEADEEMILITGTNKITDEYLSNSQDYALCDILATFEQFPIGVRRYLYESEYAKLQSQGKYETIKDLDKFFRNIEIADKYTSLEDYIRAVENDIDDFELEYTTNDTAFHMFNSTFMFHTKGKYGICRLKRGFEIKELLEHLLKLSVKDVSSIPYATYFDILLEPIYDKIDIPDSHDHIVAIKNRKYGVIDGNNLTQHIPFEYDEMDIVNHSHCYYIVQKNNRVGVLDYKGDNFIPIKYDDIIDIGYFSFVCVENGKYVLFNNNEIIYNLNIKIKHLKEELFVFGLSQQKQLYFLANERGEIMFPLGASKIFLADNGNEICLMFKHGHIMLNMDLTIRSYYSD